MTSRNDGITAQHQPVLERVPGWESYPWLRAAFSTRLGGLSQAFGENELNLGWTDDDPAPGVAANRAAFVSAAGKGSDLEMVTVRQVHSSQVRDVDTEARPLMTCEGRAALEGDGMITATRGRMLAILTADCVPVLLADTRTHAVGAFHAGWRGTLAQIAGTGLAAMQRRFGSQPGEILAAIGPCIQRCCFEIGPEVRAAFEQNCSQTQDLFHTSGSGQLFMNLVEANRRLLLQAGVPPENIHASAECTACTRRDGGGRKYFSYRAERGRTGRMLSAIAAVA